MVKPKYQNVGPDALIKPIEVRPGNALYSKTEGPIKIKNVWTVPRTVYIGAFGKRTLQYEYSMNAMAAPQSAQ